ncbi:ABC transporter substrate-binding protein [Lysinibacillus mangiferihumi]|uniref:ABC transporter substrate-binding protein n=1 Tax=Lysinibacillus mangiferihumi TaxID=1130819 RepID=A0A4U2YTW4_9BACI|nr:ABC transporter substrate-binding protein [Lysinibacillus mangiferihumi]TKI63561.1 ABC transporter substrate-binding protein [Lysinibacillus mangiferihumi]
MKKYNWLTMLLVCIMLLLVACSGGTSTENGNKNNGKSSGKNPATTRGNELVVRVAGDPQNWDPIDTYLVAWSTVGTSVFEGLVSRSLDLEIQPGLAESWDYVDDKTIVFKLRQGVTFHDGEPFNAEAVKFTFDRLLGEEGQKGPQYSNYTSINRVEVTGEYEVTMHLNSIDPVLLTKLSGYGAVIVPPKYIEEHGAAYFDMNPVGTGPFKMTDYQRDKQVVIERYEDYWNKDAIKLDKVTFKVIPETATALAELQTGNIDIMTRLEVSQAPSAEDTDFITLMDVATPTAYSIRFDTSKAPVDDVRVRQAINYAIDKETIVKEILGGYGNLISSFQSELSFGYNKDLQPYPYDPEKAKKLLAEAKIAEGTTLDFFIPGTDGTFKEIAQAVAFYLEEVGLKVSINSVENTTFQSELIPNGEAGHMYKNGWGGWTLDFDNTAYLMYHEGEFWNPSYKNDEVEQLLAKERATNDSAEREKIFKELTEVLYEDATEVNLYSEVEIYAVNKRVKNFQPPHDGRFRFENVTVE